MSSDGAWHDAKPGPTSSLDEVRFWVIREIGKIQETSRYAGKHLRVLMNDVDGLKAQIVTKADAVQSVREFDRVREEIHDGGQRVHAAFNQLRQQVGEELTKTTAQLDSSTADAKVSNLADMVQAFSTQVQDSFNHVAAVEASFQTHVSQNFEEAVGALK